MLPLTTQNVHTGNLILVNAYHGILDKPKDFLVPACDRFPEILLQRCAATLLNELMQEIDGWSFIVPVSGYRSPEEQQRIWDDSLRDNGEEFTRKYVAVPGHSEHQTGLAIDLGLKAEHIDFIRPDFPYSSICQTFREKAPKYGFILRYPAGKEKKTGIGHEPWHFRYVGTPHAQVMTEADLTLEEYMEFIRQFPYGGRPYLTQSGSRQVRISYFPAKAGTDFSGKPLEDPDRDDAGVSPESLPQILSADFPCTVSGNNIDGFILTEYICRS